MASLFDIAAGLSQFDSGSDGAYARDNAEAAPEEQDCGSERNSTSDSRHCPRLSVLPSRRQSALCILDETLQTIYDTRRASVTPLSASKSGEQLETRLQQLNAATKQHSSSMQSFSSSSLSSELRKVFTHSVSYPQLQQMQTTTSSYSSNAPLRSELAVARHSNSQLRQRYSLESGGDPDMIAKTVLREINDEIERLGLAAASCAAQRSPDDQKSMARFLTEKYIDARLNKLPGTPFVQLARQKALQKIQQLHSQQQHPHHQQRQQSLSKDKDTHAQSVNKVVAAAAADAVAPSHHLELRSEAGAGEQLLWQQLVALTPQQREMLRKLARVPETHVASLPAAQRELVQFARRLELLRGMSARELGRLEPRQQQIVRQLQLEGVGYT